MRVHTAEVTQIDSKPKAKAEVSLETLYAQHHGKVADKWSAYLREYDRILSDHRERPVRLLEIGVQNGGSLEVWADFFTNAEKIIGCDINRDCAKLRYDDERIVVVVGDANTDEAQRAIAAHAPKLDVVIDDGSHRSGDIVQSFVRYFPLLAEDGVFIVEDLHCSYWAETDGGLFHPYSSMAFLKRLADVINHEHWGVARFRADLVRGITEHYGVQLHEQELGRIHAIEFCNSMCVIRKAPTDDNVLGTRTIVGTQEPVFEGILNLQGMPHSETVSQTENPWSSVQRPPEEEIVGLRAAVAPLAETRALVEGLSRDVAERDQRVSTVQAQIDVMRAQLTALEQERASWRSAVSERDRRVGLLATELANSIGAREKEHRIARRERDAIAQKARKAEADLAHARAELKKVKATLSWRMTKPLRKVRTSLLRSAEPGKYQLAVRRARKVLRQQGLMGATRRALEIVSGRVPVAPVVVARKPGLPPPAKPGIDRRHFETWLKHHDALTAEGRAALCSRAARFAYRPLISVIVPTYNPKLAWLSEAIESVKQQLYPNWELCIVDDASTDPSVREFLATAAAADPRVRVAFREENGHISRATNTGFEMARGEWFALLDHDDVMREHALFWVVEALNRNDKLRLLYSDEDKILDNGERAHPYFKPDWNPDLFLSHNMICHLGVYHAQLVRDVGGCRAGLEGAQDYDLALRCVERLDPAQIHHIPRVLYSWRVHEQSTASDGEAKPYAVLAGQRALDEHFQRMGIAAHTEIEPSVSYRTHYELPAEPPRVSIVIPTRNAERLVRQCIDSVVRLTTYPNYEILLIDNGSDDADALKYFSQLAKNGVARVIRDDRPFNYSALNNAAVKLAHGEFICLLNNDIEVISPDWLEQMVSIGLQPGVGAVGARLWYPNGHLQHGGVVLGIGGVAGHSHKNHPRDNRGYFARAALIQSFSAVTAACLVVRKKNYELVDGLDETNLQVAFNDVDFCLRLREAGLRNVWTPYAELYHHESATRGYEDNPIKVARFEREVRFMKARWSEILTKDPAYNPNLSLDHEDFSWAWPPRVSTEKSV